MAKSEVSSFASSPEKTSEKTASNAAAQNARFVLGVACFLLFAARAIQHLTLGAPFRMVLWDQSLLEPWVNRLLGMPWETYARDPKVDTAITGIIRGFGALYACCALASLPGWRWSRLRSVLLGCGAAGLCWLAVLYGLEKFLRAGEFLEFSSQCMAPMILILMHTRLAVSRLPIVLGRLAIAGTFIGHGLYAMGYYPVPGNFVDMVIIHLGVGESTARQLLFGMGCLDLFVAAGMVLPFRFARPFLVYAMVWGGITALARFRFGFDMTQSDFGATWFVPEILWRAPHAALPLWVLLMGPVKQLLINNRNN